MSAAIERVKQVGDYLSAIANVAGLVEAGRIPIRINNAKVSGEPAMSEFDDNVVFYNVPPTGFTLGKNGCRGVVDPYELTVEYFSDDGHSLGYGMLIGVRAEEAKQMDVEIAWAREKFGY